MNNDNQAKYFIYARKSSEGEERQARSIEDQLALIWKRVRESRIKIVEELTESQTARTPGRPIFDEMIRRIEAGEANGIIAYHPDRLARNSVDGGKIMYLLDTGKLQYLLFENHWFEHSSQGMYMLYMAFAQSKYYTDNLSDVVRRGINSRLKRGVYPGAAKKGYLNHPRTKEIIPNPETFGLIKEMFQLYASGRFGLGFLGQVMHEKGLHNNIGNPLSSSQVQTMLKDPFYYGHFMYNGETYEGIHKPCISKELYDSAQAVMTNKGKAKCTKEYNHAFLGLMKCGECGYSITADEHKGHTYYHCSKKNSRIKPRCQQPYIREENLLAQLQAIAEKVALPDEGLKVFQDELNKLTCALDSRDSGHLAEVDSEIEAIQARVSRLADLYIERDISRAEYTARKESLLSEKIALLERRKKVVDTTGRQRIELMRQGLKPLQDWNSSVAGDDHKKLRDFVSEVGSNLKLNSRELLWDWISPYCTLASRGVCTDWLTTQDEFRTWLKSADPYELSMIADAMDALQSV